MGNKALDIVNAILQELNKRKGFDNWFEDIDEEIKNEIKNTLEKIVDKELQA